MSHRGLLKARMIAYFVTSGILVLGAPTWKRMLTGAAIEWSGQTLAEYFVFLIAAVVFFWAGLRLRTRLRNLPKTRLGSY
jgi:hypothetical protein